MTRRRAFTIAAQGLGGIAGAAIILPAVGFAVAPIFHRGKERWEAVGPVGDFVEDTYRQVVFTETEGIGDAGKTTAYVRKGSHELDEDPGLYIAVSNRCAHLGCPVRFVEAAGNFICPCHGGVYDFQGKRIGGPPVRPLDQFQTRVRNGQVEVGPRYSVTSQLEPVRARDPGEFTGGIWEYLYPPRPSTFPAALMPKIPIPKIPDKVVPAPLRKPAKPGAGGDAKGQAPTDLKTCAAGARRRTCSASASRPKRRPSTCSPGSTSAPAPAASSPGCSTARCRRGPTGSTRSAPRPSSPSSSRPSPASSWRCSTRRRPPRPTPRSPTSTTRSRSAPSCTACTSGARA